MFRPSVAWQFWIDRGGTFTDCLGLNPDTGALHSVKIRSSNRAPLEGIRRILKLADDSPIPPCSVRLGTTLATNALLERRGARCALLVSKGFADLLVIGTQARPDIFALEIEKTAPLYELVCELDAAVDKHGATATTPKNTDVQSVLASIKNRGIESIAISFKHAYLNPDLERTVADMARDAGFEHVYCSHEAAPEIGYLRRTETTVVDAYLTPMLTTYLSELQSELPGSDLRIMQSSGRLIDPQHFFGRNAIVSGPAGGVVAAEFVANTEGAKHSLGFDMGGTSTDVCRFDEQAERVYASTVAGVRLAAPSMDIETVAAGGGSLCRRDGQRLTVGPESAGAVPGPLCYGHVDATDLAITDINVHLGRFVADRFELPLSVERVEPKLVEISEELLALGHELSPEEVAAGFFDVANAAMAEALRKVSIARGQDPRAHTLIVFGGAGGQHATAVARLLGIRRLLFHPQGGVLSALGMGLAREGHGQSQDLGRESLDKLDPVSLKSAVDRLANRPRGFAATEHRVRLDLRYAGTETVIGLPYSASKFSKVEFRKQFERLHKKRFGYARAGHAIEAVAVRVESLGAKNVTTLQSLESSNKTPQPVRTARMYGDGHWHDEVPVFVRESLSPGFCIEGPAIIAEDTATIVVDPGFEATVLASGTLELVDHCTAREIYRNTDCDPVSLEIFAHRFMAIAEQMGETLARTALSPNIRERLDFSCAVFNQSGELVANAPHIPVHLGAMGASVRGVLQSHPNPEPGDVFASNDPSLGGSHLPDITVVTPVFNKNNELSFFVANRGHHADIGGITPGSMPPQSTSLEEEGVVLRAVPIVKRGEFLAQDILHLLNGATHPARNPEENLADLQAQIAANNVGVQRLTELSEQQGLPRVHAYMEHVMRDGAERVEEALAALTSGTRSFADQLDDGTKVEVQLNVQDKRLLVDFSGCADQVDGNANAPRAVAIAAVLYVLRTLIGRPIPLNQGCLRPVEIKTRAHSLLEPDADRAVCSGNVETSQRVVDVLLGALGRAAASQGTMNNVTFGNKNFGYYETLAGGAGATPVAAGADAVHTHMTNTRITDPEVLEARFPVELIEFRLAHGTGGAGKNRGGHGLVRTYRFTEDVQFTLLSERRSTQPFGLAKGQSGAAGRGEHQGRPIPGRTSFAVKAGETVSIQTPGGGGYGR